MILKYFGRGKTVLLLSRRVNTSIATQENGGVLLRSPMCIVSDVYFMV